MRILALESSFACCSVAVWQGLPGKSWTCGDILAQEKRDMAQGHAKHLVPLIESCLEKSGLAWSDLDRLACTIGPGGFTGVRIGLATARGLALATGLPLIGVSSLEVLAMQALGQALGQTLEHKSSEPPHVPYLILPTLDSRRQDLFVQLFLAEPMSETLSERSLPCAIPPENLKQHFAPHWNDAQTIILIGDAVVTTQKALKDQEVPCLALQTSSAPATPEASWIAHIAANRPIGEPPKPLYLRPPDVSPPSADRGKALAQKGQGRTC